MPPRVRIIAGTPARARDTLQPQGCISGNCVSNTPSDKIHAHVRQAIGISLPKAQRKDVPEKLEQTMQNGLH